MTKTTADMTQIATDLVLATQSATLRLLEVEMEAIAQMMPGAATEPAPLPTEQEVEDGFDNMPV